MGPYSEGWSEYRKYRRELLIVWLGGVPVVGAIAEASLWLFHTLVPAQVAGVAWMLLFLFAGVRCQTFCCPRCGEGFSAKGWYNKSFLARECVHCGLPKFSEDATSEGA
jgi:hypothetical protein